MSEEVAKVAGGGVPPPATFATSSRRLSEEVAKVAGGGVGLEERLDVVGCSPIHRSEGQYQGLESDTGREIGRASCRERV